jgi:hypothetical protein
MSVRFPRGMVVFWTPLVVSQSVNHHMADSVANSILYQFRSFTSHHQSTKALIKKRKRCSEGFWVAWSVFEPAICSFCIKNVVKSTMFSSQPLRHHLSDCIEDSILYQIRGSFLNHKRTEYLFQVISPDDLLVAWSFFWTGGFILSVYKLHKFLKKKLNFLEPTVETLVVWFRCVFAFVSILSVYLHNKGTKSLIQGTCPGNFLVALFFFLYINCFNFWKKAPVSRANR